MLVLWVIYLLNVFVGKGRVMKYYGKELIIDLHECDPSICTRESLQQYFEKACEAMNMERCEMHFWDDEGLPPEECQTNPQTTGVTAVQFILTSNITVHTLTLLKKVFINIFSCGCYIRTNQMSDCKVFCRICNMYVVNTVTVHGRLRKINQSFRKP